jgi:hypothetical protein
VDTLESYFQNEEETAESTREPLIIAKIVKSSQGQRKLLRKNSSEPASPQAVDEIPSKYAAFDVDYFCVAWLLLKQRFF